MAKSGAQRVREHRARKRVTVKAEPAVVVGALLPVELGTSSVRVLPIEGDDSTVRRILLAQALNPLPPADGGAVIVSACKAILEDSRKRREEARAEKLKDVEPFDFGDGPDEDDNTASQQGGTQ